MTINQIQDEIIEEFALFDNKNDQYGYIIELGKKLENLPKEEYKDENLIKGCQSKVWLTAEKSEQEGELSLKYLADSDSTLVKGLVSLLMRVLSNQPAKEILSSELYFIDKIGLGQLLSMNRSNGLASMVKQMKIYALAYQAV
ncbi:SufE protein probably involved in Fe-S center assembly [Bernardetia litoralis DSM 6794]|uniref:SufE protein probably involved in Fe-S center assembly n=1 Tax=Bernardetia litoralis (strain ATCC 23117 / DSM 6794 / NBRC 15988 / NCIMB 1366 / Fx l1 / Sio-4) TaxID=880071 RepID=I4AQZ4_BERLS|nr:SufE family protein [Bernardetia litoralis]AFM06379.1 SufE protein probably involved in Fe-S center assembly [Bernardetia litoralis DSM 6794]